MGGPWRFDIPDRFLVRLRALSADDQAAAKLCMRLVLDEPLGPAPHLHRLPPPYAPGSMRATNADIAVEYIVEADDGGPKVVFLRVRRRW